MHFSDIETIVNYHIEKRRSDAYTSIQELLKTGAGVKALRIKDIKNVNDITYILEEKYGMYINAVKNGVDNSIAMFKKYGIQFRLYDVHSFQEEPGTLVFNWIIDGKEYNFAVVGNIDHGTYYKIGCFFADELMHGSYKSEYSFEEPLPEWFISGLKKYSC